MQQPSPTSESTATSPPALQPARHGLKVGSTVAVRGGFSRPGGFYKVISDTEIERLPFNRKKRRRRLKFARSRAGR